MRETRVRLDGLARLHRIADPDERRAVFRQAFANLSTQAAERRPAPLEGLDPGALRDSVRVALRQQLLDDLGWLSTAHAAAAIYELANALPACDEKRELGRRVLLALNEGDAQTFVLLATQLALASKRGLSGASMRARVALALDLPIGSGLALDPLALALVSRKDLEDEWLAQSSQGSLPSRRLAARLLERAAREIARRASEGDESPLQVLERPSVVAAWRRLFLDREPLVWRHVASARGLLSGIVARFDQEIADDLLPSKTPTEWRRAATSLAATLAVEPERAVRRCEALLASDLCKKDGGLAASMILGLTRAADAEPQAAERLLATLVRSGGIDAIEALSSLREERLGDELSEWTARLALARLRETEIIGTPGADDGHDALLLALRRALQARTTMVGETPGLLDHLEDARQTFLEQDARTAHGRSIEILAAVEVTLQRLERADDATPEGRREAFSALRELDAVLFETSTLVDLLTLGIREGARDSIDAGRARSRAASALTEIVGRLGEWLVARESEPIEDPRDVTHPTLRLRRLRTLLHLVDADAAASEERAPETRERRLRLARLLLDRARRDVSSPLRRVLHAAAARACEGLLREDGSELSDVFVTVVRHLETERDFATFAEASMVPETAALFRAYAGLVERVARPSRSPLVHVRHGLDGLRLVLRNFPPAAGPRVEAFRLSLLELVGVLDEIGAASSLAELAGHLETSARDAQHSRLLALAEACESIARLTDGALRRFGYDAGSDGPACGPALRLLDVAALHMLRGHESAFHDALAGASDPLHVELPFHIAEIVSHALQLAGQLPRFAPVRAQAGAIPLVARRDRGLPPWLPPSRILGGFFVLRALGSGAVGSVFVARRAEEKADESAPRFALKVPEYGGSVARTLSEEEFFQLFREEAGALLAVPPHPNLARLVTFDAGARPKPILVMELVDGPTLERVIETGGLDMRRAVHIVLGVAEGLAAMHAVGVGHLDLKPGNVILRDPDGAGPALEAPVLVDFGLAGRKVRPGCATANYGAPEVWGLLPKKHVPSPAATDVYAYACLVYEVLTGRELFRGESDLAIITSHLQHDGDLHELDTIAEEPSLQPLAELLRAMLRQDPRKRISIDDARAALTELAPRLTSQEWPLGTIVVEVDAESA